jgi:hypothetical protein
MRSPNSKLLTYIFAVMLAISNIAYTSSASATAYYGDEVGKPTGGEMLADTVLVRPLMLVGTAVGIVTFVITLPFSALGGNIDEAAETLVYEPAKYTFVRPLGDL